MLQGAAADRLFSSEIREEGAGILFALVSEERPMEAQIADIAVLVATNRTPPKRPAFDGGESSAQARRGPAIVDFGAARGSLPA